MDAEQRAAGYAEYDRFAQKLSRARATPSSGGAELHSTSEGKRDPRVAGAAVTDGPLRRDRRAAHRLLPGRDRRPRRPRRRAADHRGARRRRRGAPCAVAGGPRVSRHLLLLPAPEAEWARAARPRSTRRACARTSSSTATSPPAGHRLVAAGPLTPSAQALSMRPDGSGGVLVTDGPFTESVEQVVGFYLVETDDRADLLRICERVRGARRAHRVPRHGRRRRPRPRRAARHP